MIETECKTPRGRIWIGDSYHGNKLEKKRNNGNYSHLRIGLGVWVLRPCDYSQGDRNLCHHSADER
jgi:hypothetical protein